MRKIGLRVKKENMLRVNNCKEQYAGLWTWNKGRRFIRFVLQGGGRYVTR
jgi:hypothetical protein